MQTLYPKPASYKKVIYYLLVILAWLGVIIGFIDLYMAIAQKQFSFNTFTGFLWAGGFFILLILTKKWKRK